MAVTKRVRYEILRRDNHTCRYCHSTDSPLTVDHVTPVALGGTDDPSNLVAACKDCNAGKSSTSPDAALVEDVRQDALRHAEVLRQAFAVVVEHQSNRSDYAIDFYDTWRACAGDASELTPDWENSIGRWFDMGVPAEIVQEAAAIAGRKNQDFRGTDRFTYMCGIVWSEVRQALAAADMCIDFAGRMVTEEWISSERYDAWLAGHRNGYNEACADLAGVDLLSLVVDGIPPTRQIVSC